MPRYVVLRHETAESDSRPSHWDLMHEPLDGGLLWTWAFAAEPGAEQQATAERLANHRTAYLDFEGPISGGRGHVRRVMEGEFRFLRADSDRVELDVASGRLPRQVRMLCQQSDQRWKVTFDD